MKKFIGDYFSRQATKSLVKEYKLTRRLGGAPVISPSVNAAAA